MPVETYCLPNRRSAGTGGSPRDSNSSFNRAAPTVPFDHPGAKNTGSMIAWTARFAALRRSSVSAGSANTTSGMRHTGSSHCTHSRFWMKCPARNTTRRGDAVGTVVPSTGTSAISYRNEGSAGPSWLGSGPNGSALRSSRYRRSPSS
ncbi:hypothetical protein [Gemmata sp.]|uniref:hypothetical protein n=1 Tax=Gemmata sp. TaxID=1914242 RepID=UPI003F7243FC